jgi:hypothetical protein
MRARRQLHGRRICGRRRGFVQNEAVVVRGHFCHLTTLTAQVEFVGNILSGIYVSQLIEIELLLLEIQLCELTMISPVTRWSLSVGRRVSASIMTV